MTKLRHFILMATLLASPGLQAATAPVNQYPPANRPKPGEKAAPDYTNNGQGLGLAILGAKIKSDGTIANGAGVTGSIHISGYGAGNYEVDFNRNVSACFYNVTSTYQYYIGYVESRYNNVNGVFVAFADASGTQIDSGFYLTVTCNQ